MGKEGLDRLGLKNNSSGFVRTNGSHPGYGTRKKAEKHDEYVEILVDDGEQFDLVACAAHGSWIEYRTDDQAAHVADALGVTEWSCMGYNNGGGAYDRWHITSTDIDDGPSRNSEMTNQHRWQFSRYAQKWLQRTTTSVH